VFYTLGECRVLTAIFWALSTLDNSLSEVHHTLITLVAVIVGSPPRTSYLWYLLFQPEKLLGSYIPGFLVSPG